MNERIKLLAGQAKVMAEESINMKISATNEELYAFAEEFAELIVQECIAIVEPSSYRRAYPENYRGGIDCLEILEERAAKIKEHFGVWE